MGVCGVGKTTIAHLLTKEMGATYIEADDFHSAENVELMRNGIALNDNQRWGWLDAVGEAVSKKDRGCVIACSALKVVYRDRLRAKIPNLCIVHLIAEEGLLRARMEVRENHFMHPDLITSQFEALQHTLPTENAIEISATLDPTEIVKIAKEFASIYLQGGAQNKQSQEQNQQ